MRILKRKVYYYLQHSFRKEGKTITREKYLGKEIPKNIEEIKKSLLEECKKAGIYAVLGKIKKAFFAEWRRYPVSAKEKVKEQIAIAFTYNTNAIEGSTITLEETAELLEHKMAPNKPLRDIEETQSHAKVFLEMIEHPEIISIPIILKWHKAVFERTKSDIAGRFRDYLVRVGDHVAPDWQDVKRLMNELIKFYSLNKARMHPVELAARIHYRFEKIHPFGDGNGRVGRLIMNSLLWQQNWPMLIIEFKKRKFYYRALQKGEDAFFNYFVRYYLRAHRGLLKRTK